MNINQKINIQILFALVAGLLLFSACTDKNDWDTDSSYNRMFRPAKLDITAVTVNTADISFVSIPDAAYYQFELSEDSLLFENIVSTFDTTANQFTLEGLESNTKYSLRVKSIAQEAGKQESGWNAIYFKTRAEQIIEELGSDDVTALTVTLRWPAGSVATHIEVIAEEETEPAVTHVLTADELAAGEVTIEGLSSETSYTATLYNNDKVRGSRSFTTLIDLGGATAVEPTDDLALVIANATEGDVLVLMPGTYTTTGAVTIDKSITIKGFNPADKPVLNVQFVIGDGVADVRFESLNMDGTGLDFAFQMDASALSIGTVTLYDLDVVNYVKSLVNGTSGSVDVDKIVIDNCVIANILTSGGDFIDFRTGQHLGELSITNSTFNTCTNGRDFIRIDNSASNFPGKSTIVSIDKCTFYATATGGKRIFYVRFADNTCAATNNIFAETDAIYTNQSATVLGTMSQNNYFNASTLIDKETSGNYTEFDPGFADAANGDFSIADESFDGKTSAGDPRWYFN